MDASLYTLIAEHKWIPLAALIIGLVVRLLKSDTKIPIDIPPRARVWVAFVLGAVASVLDAIVAGTPWKKAAADGVFAAILAIVGHNVVIDSLRGGKELAIPGLVKPGVPPGPGKPPSIPPPGGKTRPPTVLPPTSTFLMAMGLVVALSGCAKFFKALDLAADKAKCVVANQDLPDKVIFVKCAIEDPEKYLELLSETRAATRKALERQALERETSTRVDAGADGGGK